MDYQSLPQLCAISNVGPSGTVRLDCLVYAQGAVKILTTESSAAEADQMMLGTFLWLVVLVTIGSRVPVILKLLLATALSLTRKKGWGKTGLPGNRLIVRPGAILNRLEGYR